MLYAISMSIKDAAVPEDFLYSDYLTFFEKLGCTLIFIPNASEKIESYFDDLPIKGVILSGGNDLSSEFTGQKNIDIRNAAPLRDLKEKRLLDISVSRKLPVFGICRGMQFINCYFGGSLTQNLAKQESEDLHIAKTHIVSLCDKKAVEFLAKSEIEVNSYHHQGIRRDQVSAQLKIMGVCAKDNLVEALFHPLLPIAGVQWHPERVSPSFDDGCKLAKAFINRELYWKED